MLAWLSSNLATILVGLFLLGVVVLIVRRMILDKKAGKHLCGSCGSCGGGCGGCGGCPMQGQCHGK